MYKVLCQQCICMCPSQQQELSARGCGYVQKRWWRCAIVWMWISWLTICSLLGFVIHAIYPTKHPFSLDMTLGPPCLHFLLSSVISDRLLFCMLPTKGCSSVTEKTEMQFRNMMTDYILHAIYTKHAAIFI